MNVSLRVCPSLTGQAYYEMVESELILLFPLLLAAKSLPFLLFMLLCRKGRQRPCCQEFDHGLTAPFCMRLPLRACFPCFSLLFPAFLAGWFQSVQSALLVYPAYSDYRAPAFLAYPASSDYRACREGALCVIGLSPAPLVLQKTELGNSELMFSFSVL